MNYTIKNDVIFSYLFSQEDIVKDFLEVCLNKKIEKVEVSNQFSLEKFDIRNKGAVLDIKAIINDEAHVDLEMQRKKDDFYVKRVLLYTGGLLRGQLDRGESYEYMKNVIMINIIDYTLFKDIKDFHTIWKLRENKNLEHEPLKGLEIHFLELEKFRKSNPNIHEKLNQWLATIDTENEKWLEVAMKENPKLKEVIIKKDNFVNDDKLARELIEAQEKWCLYRRVEVISADDEVNTRIDPYDKAKLIKNLFKINMDIDTISEVTGLSKNRILDIKHVLNVVSKGRFERDVMKIKEECDLDYKKRISDIKKKGYDEGYAVGLAKGKLGKEKLIKKLLKMDMDIETVSKVTDLAKDQLNKLKKDV